MQIRWIGDPPASAWRTALRRAGLRLSRGARTAAVEVRFSRRARPPAVPRGSSGWLWLCRAKVPLAQARRALERGAYDVITTQQQCWAEQLAARAAELARGPGAPPPAPGFVSESAAARRTLDQLWGAARTSMPLLLTGETGTGKDLCARLVHDWSSRRQARFVPINCAAVPHQLIEAELFGYVRGAFSGAVRDYDGLLTAAAGGTVFLDEIDDTPPTLQAKLLRVLEDRVVSRLGENVWRQVDFRIVAATNRDLGKLIGQGRFGADLYERLAIVSVELPPLRDRGPDLPGLVEHMIARYYVEEPAAAGAAVVQRVSPLALAALAAYPWPGNVRALRNAIFAALVHKRAGDELLLSDLPQQVLARAPAATAAAALVDADELERRIAAGRLDLRGEVDALERSALQVALRLAGGNASAAARLLGRVGRGTAADPGGTVRAMMRRLGVMAAAARSRQPAARQKR